MTDPASPPGASLGDHEVLLAGGCHNSRNGHRQAARQRGWFGFCLDMGVHCVNTSLCPAVIHPDP